MPESIKWSVTFDAVLGPRVTESGTLEVAAYDKLNVRLDGSATGVDLDVQPSATAGDVQLLVMRASVYDPPLTYSPDGGTTQIPLDGPVVLVGSGAVSLLDGTPQTLHFTNPNPDPVDVEILVGRRV